MQTTPNKWEAAAELFAAAQATMDASMQTRVSYGLVGIGADWYGQIRIHDTYTGAIVGYYSQEGWVR